jgi:tRNA dimethylallyltransferase
MKYPNPEKLICILGPTASGKTKLATNIAFALDGEIISADSRQVYKQMNIGTGKDLEDFQIHGRNIPYHLIDICEPGYKYSVYKYQRDFLKTYVDIKNRDKIAIICGGTGMYIEAVTKAYKLINVPLNPDLRSELNTMNDEQLIGMLQSKKKVHNTTDFTTRKRLIRAIEIAVYEKNTHDKSINYPDFDTLYIGINIPRHQLREQITNRLKLRLNTGMIEEVDKLLKDGIQPDDLIFYGLEYKFLTQYLLNQLKYDQMFQLLNTAIHQFAKRQMTWFRRMERNGDIIHWLDGNMSTTTKTEQALEIIHNFLNKQ